MAASDIRRGVASMLTAAYLDTGIGVLWRIWRNASGSAAAMAGAAVAWLRMCSPLAAIQWRQYVMSWRMRNQWRAIRIC